MDESEPRALAVLGPCAQRSREARPRESAPAVAGPVVDLDHTGQVGRLDRRFGTGWVPGKSTVSRGSRT